MSPSCTRCSSTLAEGHRACGQCGHAELRGHAPPRLPDRYEVVGLLGRGAMGLVFRCRDRELALDVAIKVLPAELAADAAACEQIRQEARAAARVRDCPGVLPLHSFERHGDSAFLIMAFVPGGSLADVLRRDGPLPESTCRRLGAEIADALAVAHSRGVLHRDVKPSNVMLDADGHALVADFGLGKVVADETARLTTASVAGTPVYMAPEVMWGTGGDARSDLYSLGCLLHEIATGKPAFSGSFPQIAGAKSPRGSLPDPRRHVAGLSTEFVRVVQKLLALDPDRRIQTAEECSALLRDASSDATSSGASAAPAGRSARTRWLVAGLVLAAVVGVSVAASVRATGPQDAPHPEARAPAVQEQPALPPVSAPDGPAIPAIAGLAAPTMPLPDGLALPAGVVRRENRLYSESDGAEMALIPGGEFVMGSDDGPADARPAHTVTLPAFLLDRHEVTVGQFRRFVAATGHRTDAEKAGWANSRRGRGWTEMAGADWRHPKGPGSSVDGRDSDVVVCVSWNDAETYAAWAGKRLPTEAEFEFVLRDGREGTAYPWGDDATPPPRYGNYRDASFAEENRGHSPIGDYRDGFPMWAGPGSTLPNSFGLYDVSGNLLEWCADWWSDGGYTNAPQHDPRGRRVGTTKCARGGSWGSSRARLSPYFRQHFEPETASVVIGFRCAMDLPE